MVELSLLESCKNYRRRVGLSFHWDIAFGIEGIVGRKRSMQILVEHGMAAGSRLQTPDTWAAMPCHREFQRLQGGCVRLCPKLKTPGAEAAMPWVLGPDPRAGSAKSCAWLGAD
jgi:hypothetical protein